MPTVEPSPDGRSITVHVPIAFARRGGRKLVITPPGHDEWNLQGPAANDDILVAAIVRAFAYKALLDANRYATISELAAAVGKTISWVSHVLRLTLLAPELVEAILDGRQPRTLQLQPLMRGFPLEWARQVGE
jgi:hypothetical protein